MYCMNCGTKNGDQAKFCVKCGQQLTDNVIIEKKPNPARKKSKSKSMVLISLVLVVAIVIVTVFNLRHGSKEQEGRQASSSDGAITFEDFSLDAIAEQCPDCKAAIETYIATLEASQDWTTAKEELEALEEQKCAQMQHFCTAQAIYVEDIPYAYRGSFGSYTGDWIGAGPSGQGTYIGTVYGTNIVSYTGGWGFGVPNGEGELYLENYLGDWDMTYTGQMKNGMRDGTGSWFEYSDGNEYKAPSFRIYDDAVYSQDQLTEWTECVKYDADTGDILEYCMMITDEAGLPLMGDSWGPNDLSPEEEKALGIATVVASFGIMAYLTYSAVTVENIHDSDAGNQSMLADVNSWRERKAAEEQERLEEEEKRQAEIRQENRDICDELEAAGKTDTWEYYSASKYSYY